MRANSIAGESLMCRTRTLSLLSICFLALPSNSMAQQPPLELETLRDMASGGARFVVGLPVKDLGRVLRED